jgi:endonuclease-3
MIPPLHGVGRRFDSGRAHFFQMKSKKSPHKKKTRRDTRDIIKAIIILKEKSKLSMLGEFSEEDPFYVLISTVLSARNRDEMTIKAVKKLFAKYKTPKEIANAPVSKLEPLIRQSGFYKTKARRIKEISRILLEKYKGKVPDDFGKLIELPGVGRKTAGCVLVYAFGKPAIPVDTHVHRISNRLGWVKTKTGEETEQELMRIIPKKYWLDVNEALVIHGQTVCKPIRPWCHECKITRYCDYCKDNKGNF